MHFRKKENEKPLFLLGLVAAGLLLTVLVISVSVSRKVTEEGVPGADAVLILQTPQAVKDNYQSAILALHQSAADTNKPLADVFEAVEKEFLSVRVPEETLDAHLAALFSIQKLNAESAAQDEVITREQLQQILAQLAGGAQVEQEEDAV